MRCEVSAFALETQQAPDLKRFFPYAKMLTADD